MKLETLYRRNQNGKIVFTELSTRKMRNRDAYAIVTKYGLHGGSKVKKSSIIIDEGVNIGKKNEKSPKQVAEQKVKAKFRNLEAKGYHSDYSLVSKRKYNTFKNGTPMPMLLSPYKGKMKEGFIQRKLDGMRCIALLYNGEVMLYSRLGNPIDIKQIKEQVAKLYEDQFNDNIIFDGEIYLHGEDLHDIIACAKTGDPNRKLEYHIYDVVMHDMEFMRRNNFLLTIDNSYLSHIKVEHAVEVSDDQEIAEFHLKATEEGYEGSVFCDPNSFYNCGNRTNGKTKIKDRITEEFVCVDHYYNKGKYSKQSTLVCQTENGNKFHVKMKGTDKQREEWATNFDTQFKDKPITIEYRKKSKNGVPIEAVGIAPRDYE